MSNDEKRIERAKSLIQATPTHSHRWATWRYESISTLRANGFSWDECADAIDWINKSNIQELYEEDKETSRKQRINEAIAKAVGLVECDKEGWGHFVGFTSAKTGKCGHENCYPPGGCPNYLENLNAMARAEDILTKGQRVEYVYRLSKILGWPSWPKYEDSCFALTHATASQKAEAFLRTLSLWKD